MAKNATKQKFAGPIRLLVQSFTDFWDAKWTVLKVVLLVSLPAGLIALFIAQTVATKDPDAAASLGVLSAYTSLATAFMNVALIWTIIQFKAQQSVSLGKSYYEGTASVVRFMMVAIILAIEVIPFILGAQLYSNGVQGGSLSAGPVENILLLAIWALLAWPSVFWLTRSIFALVIVPSGSLRPIAAVLKSSRLVKGRTLGVLARLLVLLVVMVILLSIPSALVGTFKTDLSRNLGAFSLQLLASIVFLPVSNFYLYNLYQALSDDQG